MKRKINLKVVLGLLFVILLVLFGIFFFFVKKDKPEEKEKKEEEIREELTNDEKSFNGSSYTYWEEKLFEYISKKTGIEPSLREVDVNQDGDLVVTFKNFNKDYGPTKEDWVKVIEVFTISEESGIVLDSKGNEIDIYNLDKEKENEES